MRSAQARLPAWAMLALVGCVHDLPSERAAILRTDKPWQEAIAVKNFELTVAFWSDDAVLMPPGQPAVVGKAAIRQFVRESFKLPGFLLQWETTEMTVAQGADLAYGVHKTTTSFNSPDGNRIVLHGKGSTVWRKRSDGSWECVLDIWNDDGPLKP